MKLWVIATEEVPVEIVGTESMSNERANDYLTRARRLVQEDAAKFHGRALEETTGQVYQVLTIDGVGDKPARTVFIADPRATRVLGTMFTDVGKLRRFRVGLGDGQGTD
jgi:hypothetical protein